MLGGRHDEGRALRGYSLATAQSISGIVLCAGAGTGSARISVACVCRRLVEQFRPSLCRSAMADQLGNRDRRAYSRRGGIASATAAHMRAGIFFPGAPFRQSKTYKPTSAQNGTLSRTLPDTCSRVLSRSASDPLPTPSFRNRARKVSPEPRPTTSSTAATVFRNAS